MQERFRDRPDWLFLLLRYNLYGFDSTTACRYLRTQVAYNRLLIHPASSLYLDLLYEYFSGGLFMFSIVGLGLWRLNFD